MIVKVGKYWINPEAVAYVYPVTPEACTVYWISGTHTTLSMSGDEFAEGLNAAVCEWSIREWEKRS